jgi:hypothetical protein
VKYKGGLKMPGNTILINNYKDLEWYVGDSKMDELVKWLNDNGEKVKNVSVKKITMYDFDKWLEDLVFPRDVDDFIEVLYDGGQGGNNENFEMKKRILFYTDNHKYTITAIARGEDQGYIGCGVSARKARPGEDWERGNDLPDGPFNTKTLEQIKNGIIAYELEQLSVKKPQDPLEEELLNDDTK